MSWNKEIKEAKRSAFNTAVFTLGTHIVTYNSEKLNASIGLLGAADRAVIAEASVKTAMETLQRIVTEVVGVNSSLNSQTSQRDVEIQQGEGAVQLLSKQVTEADALNNIRQEQVNALRKKYSSNLHTSWLGLWRPMDETSRFGLFVAAIAFGCLAVFSIAYLFWTRTPAAAAVIEATVGSPAALFGGFRFRLGRKQTPS